MVFCVEGVDDGFRGAGETDPSTASGPALASRRPERFPPPAYREVGERNETTALQRGGWPAQIRLPVRALLDDR